MKKWRIILSAVAAALALYVSSYLAMSVSGRYKSDFWGLGRGANGTARFVPKFGYDWHPFDLYTKTGKPSVRGLIFFLMIRADRAFWHKKDLAESGRFEIQTYPDIAE